MFCFSLQYFHDLSQTCPNGRQLTFFVYWFLDGFRFIKELQKPFRTFWIYISIFTQPIRFSLLNSYCNIYNLTNPVIDFMRSITENITNVKVMSELVRSLCD